jgi:hypothetical protein
MTVTAVRYPERGRTLESIGDFDLLTFGTMSSMGNEVLAAAKTVESVVLPRTTLGPLHGVRFSVTDSPDTAGEATATQIFMPLLPHPGAARRVTE